MMQFWQNVCRFSAVFRELFIDESQSPLPRHKQKQKQKKRQKINNNSNKGYQGYRTFGET